MAEVGVIASIVGIAAVGVQLSRTLYELSSSIRHTATNINRIATSVSLFSLMLKQVARVLEDTSPCTRPRRSRIGGADKDVKSRSKIMQKIKWHFEQHRVEILLARLEHLKTTLSVLMQTLSVAALMKQLEEQENVRAKQGDEVRQERMHVWTLLIARHVSYLMLKRTEAEEVKETDDAVTVASDADNIAQSPAQLPKLITQASNNSLTLTKDGQGGLEVVDKSAKTITDADDDETSPVAEQAGKVVDLLLAKWTTLPQQMDFPTRYATFDGSKSLDSSQEVQSPILAGPPRRTSSPKVITPSSPPKAVGWHGRSSSDESDVSTLNNGSPVQTVLDKQLVPGPPRANEIAKQQSLPIRPTVPHGPRHVPPNPFLAVTTIPPRHLSVSGASPMSTSRMHQPYNTSFNKPPSNASTNYRAPFTEDWQSEIVSSSDESDPEHFQIPWRIRAGPRHWDFVDDRLVGPATPFLPSEPIYWVCSQPNASTEISAGWVNEQALREHGFPHYEMEWTPSDRPGHGEPGWRIKQALYYVSTASILEMITYVTQDDIQSLVERTVSLFNTKRSRRRSGAREDRRESSGPHVPMPHSTQQPQRPTHLHPQSQSQPQVQQRSVSFSNSPSRLRERSPALPSPAGYFDHGPPQQPARPTTRPNDRGDGRRHHDERERERGADRDRDRERDREREREREKEKEREREREKSKTHHHRKHLSEREKERKREEERRKERKGSTKAAIGIARLGGLAALLEGLDGLDALGGI
ncbi:hypothetical protein MRB53_037905 [Persea americana]|nr:hypothetical protein MRB53_037905 [Persea americana]